MGDRTAARRAMATRLWLRRFLPFAIGSAASFVASPGFAEDAWSYGRSVAPGSSATGHFVRYTGPRERGFDVEMDCGVSVSPTVHVSVQSPGPELRRIKFDAPVPVEFRFGPPIKGSAPTAGDVVRVSGLLTEGVSQYVDRVRISVGMQGAVSVGQALARDPGPSVTAPYVVVEIGGTSARFALTGARKAILELIRSCPTWPR